MAAGAGITIPLRSSELPIWLEGIHRVPAYTRQRGLFNVVTGSVLPNLDACVVGRKTDLRMTDDSGVPAAPGVPPEDDVDPQLADAGTGESSAEGELLAEGEPPADGEGAAAEPPPGMPTATPTPTPTPPPKTTSTPGQPEQGIPRRYQVGLFGASLFGLFILGVGLSLVYVLIKIWPKVPHAPTGGGAAETAAKTAAAASKAAPKPIDLFWGLFQFNLLPDTALIVLTAVMGGIGATIFIAISFGDFVGNRRFAKNWIWFYLVRLFVGPALALVFYFAVRGGFLATSATGTDINPYGIAALAGLVGLFSKRAGDKLKEVFDTLFQTAQDDARGDSVTNPLPTIGGIEPLPTRNPETLTFTLQGAGFIEASTVSVGRSTLDGEQPMLLPRKTTFLSETELGITLLTEDVAETGLLWISVTNPAPGGGTAGPQAFEIT